MINPFRICAVCHTEIGDGQPTVQHEVYDLNGFVHIEGVVMRIMTRATGWVSVKPILAISPNLVSLRSLNAVNGLGAKNGPALLGETGPRRVLDAGRDGEPAPASDQRLMAI